MSVGPDCTWADSARRFSPAGSRVCGASRNTSIRPNLNRARPGSAAMKPSIFARPTLNSSGFTQAAASASLPNRAIDIDRRSWFTATCRSSSAFSPA